MTDKNTFNTVDASNINAVIAEVTTRLAQGKDVDPYEVINLFADTKSKNLELSALFVSRGLITEQEFKAALGRKKRNEEIMAKLGYVPKNARDYVEKFAKANEVEVQFNGEMKKRNIVTFNGAVITQADLSDPLINRYYRARSHSAYNLELMKRSLRLDAEEASLKFTHQSISDAVEEWLEVAKIERKSNMFTSIAYQPNTKACGPVAKQMWLDMEKAAFDVSATKPGFAIAVLKKFMWQVKRKAVGEAVYNHLMPVITGRQGTGKSTLVNNMLSVINDGVKNATFSDIADPRLIDMWETPVLFLDEMSGAKKADMNTVKQAITATSLTRRPMRTNTDIQVMQQSTFIGCSNDSLSEIIRDTTGLRRFAELEFSNKPDWKLMNTIDWKLLWQSVDEFAEDPSITVMDMLADQQEDNRNMCSVETWARQKHPMFKDWTIASTVFATFTDWENDNFKGYNTTLNSFGRKMTTLMKRFDDLGWDKEARGGKVYYKVN